MLKCPKKFTAYILHTVQYSKRKFWNMFHPKRFGSGTEYSIFTYTTCDLYKKKMNGSEQI